MRLILLPFALLAAATLHAQIWSGADTLYGNEWIDFSRTYYRIPVASDGVYRISRQTLSDAGFPVGTVPAGQFRLYRYGRQEPIYTTTAGLMGAQDFVEFFSDRNRDALDRHLFYDPDAENLNPWYSLFNDTTAYYLSWETTGQPLRYTTVPNDLSNPPPAEPFIWFETGYYYTNYLFKRQISDEVTYSWFNGDGFATYPATDFSVPLYPRKLAPSGPPASLEVQYGCNLGPHLQQVRWNDSLLVTDEFLGWGVQHHRLSIPLSQVKTANLARIQSALGGNDRNAVAAVFLRYPRLPDLEGAGTVEFYLDGNSAPQYLEIQSVNTSGGKPVVYERTQGIRMEADVQNGVVRVLLPASGQQRRLWLANPDAGIAMVKTLRPVTFRNYQGENADYIILSNSALYKDPSTGADYVAEYAAYRSSPDGGHFKVAVVDVNELYEQFAYGVRYHPLALRNFIQYIHRHWANPRYLLLLGKALDYNNFRTAAAQQTLADSLFFVPTYGSPGADQLLVMREKRLSDPLMAVGRLAVTKPSEIRDYLDKLKAHEQLYREAPQTLAGKAWMKRVIHNSGGLAGETDAIRSYVQDMTGELAQNRVGADIYTYYKTSNDPIQTSSYEQMLDLINGGVSVWMIFGHSSPNAVDFDIGAPSAYQNKDRYPLMMIMGCFSGLCSTPQQGIGEQFVLAPERGAIAYFASVNFSFTDALHTFGKKFYERLGGADYGQSVGDIFRHTVSDLNKSGYSALIALLHQNLLQGDPAVKLHFYPGSDYVVDPQSVQFSPNPVSLDQAALHLKFDVVNIGEHTGGDIPLTLNQRLPNGQEIARLSDTIPAPAFRQQQSYTLPTAGSQVGFNRFLLALDPLQTLAEQPDAARFNNALTDANGQPGLDVYFFAEDVAPVYPPPYGIVRGNTVALHASTLNLSAPPMRYLFELDTLETFDSPFKKTTEIVQRGGLLTWKPPLVLQDSTVYYWRVGRDSLVNGQVPWRSRSFICLPGSAPGWNQSHYGQYAAGQFLNLQAVDSTRRLEFSDNAGYISLTVGYRNMNRYPGMQNAFYEGFFGDAGFYGLGLLQGVMLMVQDPKTGHVVPNLPGSPYNPSTKKKAFFTFDTRDSLQRIALMHFIENEIPPGFIVGLLAVHAFNDTLGYAPRRWARDSVSYGKNLFQVLENQGAREARALVNYTQVPRPYGFIFQKDNPAFNPVDTTVTPFDAEINIRRNFLAKWASGYLETPPVGPAKAWKGLHWQHGHADNASDTVQLSVWGIRDGQTDTLLLVLPGAGDTSLGALAAAQFPYLKLRYETGDTVRRTATQPAYLRVLYDPVPEGALHPVARYDFQADTLQQGEPGRVAIAFANVSDAPFDSLRVKFRVENDASIGKDYWRVFRPLPPGDTLQLTWPFETRLLRGKQRLLVDANPPGNQAELYHFNNTAFRDFIVSTDQRNPLLDVTFDGQHLMDGDIVSPQPVVILTLRDENRFLPLRDTATFALTLVRPDGSRAPVPIHDPAVQFFPADAGALPKKNQARLEWRPVFPQDGDYQLVVNGKDASGNPSGALNYTVNFRVITHSALSNLLNYPNPFSTSTCFVYTMTGAEPPAQFRLQLMTVGGKVVREVSAAEFGPLRAGTHVSTFCWDGRDQYGDQLANGVYLYHVVAKKADGTDFGLWGNEATDVYFKGGWGKMVLMR